MSTSPAPSRPRDDRLCPDRVRRLPDAPEPDPTGDDPAELDITGPDSTGPDAADPDGIGAAAGASPQMVQYPSSTAPPQPARVHVVTAAPAR
jgi:hypothetical protein